MRSDGQSKGPTKLFRNLEWTWNVNSTRNETKEKELNQVQKVNKNKNCCDRILNKKVSENNELWKIRREPIKMLDWTFNNQPRKPDRINEEKIEFTWSKRKF